MKTYSAPKVAIAAFGMAFLLTSCGITGGSNGDGKAAMSCIQDLSASLNSAMIVSTGIAQRSGGEVKEATTDLIDVRKRAILAAEAAAANSYWQPLADAWALNEAMLQALVDDGTEPYASYSEFLQNVNLDYAATSKDTYCRIAFSKNGIAIDYESDSK